MSCLISLSTWADEIIMGDKVYYFAARQKILKEIPLFFKTTDTVYRNLIILKEKGLIEYFKFGIKDLFRLTNEGKKWNQIEVDSVLSDHDPSPVVEIRQDSDSNPTYQNTSDQKTIHNEKEKNIQKTKRFVKPTLKELREYIKEQNYAVDPEEFLASNEAKGWVVGEFHTPMKNWKAAVFTWHKRAQSDKKKKTEGEHKYQSLDNLEYANERRRRLENERKEKESTAN